MTDELRKLLKEQRELLETWIIKLQAQKDEFDRIAAKKAEPGIIKRLYNKLFK